MTFPSSIVKWGESRWSFYYGSITCVNRNEALLWSEFYSSCPQQQHKPILFHRIFLWSHGLVWTLATSSGRRQEESVMYENTTGGAECCLDSEEGTGAFPSIRVPLLMDASACLHHAAVVKDMHILIGKSMSPFQEDIHAFCLWFFVSFRQYFLLKASLIRWWNLNHSIYGEYRWFSFCCHLLHHFNVFFFFF